MVGGIAPTRFGLFVNWDRVAIVNSGDQKGRLLKLKFKANSGQE